MTLDAFRARYRDVLAGMIATSATRHAQGGELAVMLRTYFAKVDALLEQMHKDLSPEPKPLPQANGVGRKT